MRAKLSVCLCDIHLATINLGAAAAVATPKWTCRLADDLVAVEQLLVVAARWTFGLPTGDMYEYHPLETLPGYTCSGCCSLNSLTERAFRVCSEREIN